MVNSLARLTLLIYGVPRPTNTKPSPPDLRAGAGRGRSLNIQVQLSDAAVKLTAKVVATAGCVRVGEVHHALALVGDGRVDLALLGVDCNAVEQGVRKAVTGSAICAAQAVQMQVRCRSQVWRTGKPGTCAAYM